MKLASLLVTVAILPACAGDGQTTGTPAKSTTASPSPALTANPEPECADLTGEATAQIRMVDFSFDPFCAIVSADQKIEFVNEGKNRHSFTVPKLDLDVLTGESKTTPKPIGEVLKPGKTHKYLCKYHPNMTAELQVE